MNAPLPPADLKFDLRTLAMQLDRVKGKLRAIYWLAIGLVVFLILLFVPVTIFRTITGTIGGLELGVTVGVSGLCGYIALQVIQGLGKTSPSAISITVSNHGFELMFPRDRTVRVDWSDPHVTLELFDFSGSLPPSPPVDSPFGVTVKGVDSALTHEAYHIVYAQAEARGLIRRSAPSPNMWYPRGVVPVVHYVRADTV